MAKNTNEAPVEAVAPEGVTLVDNTGADAPAETSNVEVEEYELTPGLVQVNYR